MNRHHRLEAICGVMAIAIASAVVGWGVVTFALSQLRTPVLGVALASRLTADYSEKSAGEIAPVDPSVILRVVRDEQSPVAVTAKVTFVPIFESQTGSQLPGATPAAERAIASATPQSPDASVSATAVPRATPTPPVAGSSATSTPPAQGGTPVPTSTSRPGATPTSQPQPTPTTPPQPTPTSPAQATPTPGGQGTPQSTHTPPGQSGTPQPTRTPSNGPQATRTPSGQGGGPNPTHTPKP